MTNKARYFHQLSLPDPLSSNNEGKPRVFHTGKYVAPAPGTLIHRNSVPKIVPKVTPVARKPAPVVEEDDAFRVDLEEAFDIEAPPYRDPLLTGAKFYFAYGSNLQQAQMSHRCPGATPSFVHHMVGHKLIFRGAADIIKTGNDDDTVSGVIWRIRPGNEEALDRYEGVRSGSYRKQTFRFWTPERNQRKALVYRNNRLKIKPPSEAYLAKIAAGYKRFGLDFDKLSEAVAFARANAGITYHD